MWHVGQTLYRALLKLHNGEFAWSMGVCNYSIGLLDEVWGLVGGNKHSLARGLEEQGIVRSKFFSH